MILRHLINESLIKFTKNRPKIKLYHICRLQGGSNQFTQDSSLEKTNTPFCPPKPKEFEIAALILTARGLFGITSS
jgi:hypothetical protein